jgi:glycine/D-amino acid oxidase-like deaminating enzyme
VIQTCDVIVIGCGIVGSACALELARAGMKVTVVEQDTPGSGATAAGMGHIVVMDDSPAQFALTSYSQSLWKRLIPELPTNVEYHACGTIWVAADDEEMAEAHRKQKYYAAQGLPVEMLDSAQLHEAEPNLDSSLAGGLRVFADAVLYPPSAAGYFIQQAQQHGASLIHGRCVQAARGEVQLEDGTRLHSQIIVNATGAVSPELTPGILVKKRKGHLIITDRYPGFLNHQLVELGYLKSAHSTIGDSVAFNVQPRKTGQLLIGSSRQYDAEDGGIDHAIVSAMIKRAALYMPKLPSLSALRIWSGFRAATPDKLPLIGPTQDPTLFLATGHEGLGITTSLATARLLVDHLLNRTSEIPLAPYLPSRVAARVADSVAHA